ncbi:hypothetical protein [Nostoc sp.]|uniref:hypothetical protein n=1 Tax=Nostoc sp. TaxID=1180 RepID=UPI003FA5B80B
MNANNADAYCSRGVILANLGEHQSAIQDYTQALCIKPFLGAAYFNRGLSRTQIRDYQRTI